MCVCVNAINLNLLHPLFPLNGQRRVKLRPASSLAHRKFVPGGRNGQCCQDVSTSIEADGGSLCLLVLRARLSLSLDPWGCWICPFQSLRCWCFVFTSKAKLVDTLLVNWVYPPLVEVYQEDNICIATGNGQLTDYGNEHVNSMSKHCNSSSYHLWKPRGDATMAS